MKYLIIGLFMLASFTESFAQSEKDSEILLDKFNKVSQITLFLPKHQRPVYETVVAISEVILTEPTEILGDSVPSVKMEMDHRSNFYLNEKFFNLGLFSQNEDGPYRIHLDTRTLVSIDNLLKNKTFIHVLKIQNWRLILMIDEGGLHGSFYTLNKLNMTLT